jgi:hypothetical protein
MRPWITGVIAGLLLLAGSAMANAGGVTSTSVFCYQIEELETMLVDQYNERKVEFGVAGVEGNYAAILWVNEEAPSWSFVIYNPVTDTACIFAAGNVWGDMPILIDPASTY